MDSNTVAAIVAALGAVAAAVAALVALKPAQRAANAAEDQTAIQRSLISKPPSLTCGLVSNPTCNKARCSNLL
jgi:hypothetical protein